MDISSGMRIPATEVGVPASSTDPPRSMAGDIPADPKMLEAPHDDRPLDIAEVSEAVDWLNARTLGSGTQLSFRVDEATKCMVLLITDAETGQLINEIPTEIALRLVRNVRNGMDSLVDQTA